MPSPFPGMDPWLEGPALFPDLHDAFITHLRDAINAQLPAPYYAGIASRVWIEAARRPIVPDVDVFRPNGAERGAAPSGGVAVAADTEAVVVTVPLEEHREPLIEIFAQPGGERLVTHIELLSPSNKPP